MGMKDINIDVFNAMSDEVSRQIHINRVKYSNGIDRTIETIVCSVVGAKIF